MKLQLLRQVKDAEDAGAKLVADAEAQAKTHLADARRDAEQLLADGKASADAARQAKLDAARKAVDKKAATILADGEKAIEELRAKFAAGVNGAADRALKIIEESL